MDTEAAIMANFEFLSREGDVDMEEDDDDDDMNDEVDSMFERCSSSPMKVSSPAPLIQLPVAS